MNAELPTWRHSVVIPKGLDPERHRIIATHIYGLEHKNGAWRRVGDVAGRILARLDPECHEKAA